MICNRCSEYIEDHEESYEGICVDCTTDTMVQNTSIDMFDDYEDVYLEEDMMLEFEEDDEE